MLAGAGGVAVLLAVFAWVAGGDRHPAGSPQAAAPGAPAASGVVTLPRPAAAPVPVPASATMLAAGPAAASVARPPIETESAASTPRTRPRERFARAGDAASAASAPFAVAEAAPSADARRTTRPARGGEEVRTVAPVAVEPAGPHDACGSRSFIALAVCMEQQCEQPRFKAHPECERVRQMVERRQRGDQR